MPAGVAPSRWSYWARVHPSSTIDPVWWRPVLPLAKVLGVAAVAVPTAILVRPRDRGGRVEPYFAGLDRALKAAGAGSPRVVIDLDRLDRNLDVITSTMPDPAAYRVVEKSLPSAGLLRHIMGRAATRRLMVLHVPYLPELLHALGPGLDVLIGKSVTPEAVAATLDALDALAAGLVTRAAAEVRWLAGTPEGLEACGRLAAARGLRLRVAIELDVGLHRGGAATPEDVRRLLDAIAADPGRLAFAGYLGYDGHVAHAPAIGRSARSAALAAHGRAMTAYAALAGAGREAHPELHGPDIVHNAGGSGSYRLYDASTPVDDVGIGGLPLRPSAYPDTFLDGLEPAMFVAAPVLADLGATRIPFLEGLTGVLRAWDPNARRAFAVYGGGWPGRIVSPPGVRPEPLTTDPPNENLVPNQSVLVASRRTPIAVGDFVFWRPVNSDALVQFEELACVRGGSVVETWRPLQRRY
jgi:D-serine deaminase-like pyridoxal phosphate-dependent protein